MVSPPVVKKGSKWMQLEIRRPWCGWLLMLLALVWTIGCGSDLASVSGTVTLDGQAISGGPELRGTVYFSPAEGSGASAAGILDSSGRYTLSMGSTEGIRPGKYVVAISATKLIPARTPGGMPGGQLITPRKYSNARDSGLEAEVQPGSNTFDFALESK
jgi:hypothetical protein